MLLTHQPETYSLQTSFPVEPIRLLVYLCRFVIVVVYYGLTLNITNLSGNVFVNFALSATLETLAYVITLILLDRLGRKPLLTASMMLSGFACTISILPVYLQAPGRFLVRIRLHYRLLCPVFWRSRTGVSLSGFTCTIAASNNLDSSQCIITILPMFLEAPGRFLIAEFACTIGIVPLFLEASSVVFLIFQVYLHYHRGVRCVGDGGQVSQYMACLHYRHFARVSGAAGKVSRYPRSPVLAVTIVPYFWRCK